uniref:Transthyretin-like protein 46 n=1 Tax=Strongyloides papillosus TaxID=174720 RepID=A0A0N5C9Z6_STREA
MITTIKLINLLLINLILLKYIPNGVLAFRMQSIGVKGTLKCGDKPASNVLVKLIDEDRGPDSDDLLDSSYTDANGSFNLSGHAYELTNIDVELRILHDCNNNGKSCQREWLIRIPEKYITQERTPKKTMNLGTLNLEVELEQEDKECKQ